MQSLREGIQEAKSKVKKANTEAEMTTISANVNKVPKGEDLLGPRGCDRKNEK